MFMRSINQIFNLIDTQRLIGRATRARARSGRARYIVKRYSESAKRSSSLYREVELTKRRPNTFKEILQ